MKRSFDLIVSAIALIALLPVMLLIAASVVLILGRPVFFTQERPGKNDRPFFIVKFRSMDNQRDATIEHLPDEQRLGKLGRFLRLTSLDELPALINVLKGEMSLVGPRPLLSEYLALYTPEQARRHEMQPGITGWAQVNGRNAVSWEEKFVLDVWYVDNQSFLLDIRILFLTVIKVIARDGISQDGHATMAKFTGSK